MLRSPNCDQAQPNTWWPKFGLRCAPGKDESPQREFPHPARLFGQSTRAFGQFRRTRMRRGNAAFVAFPAIAVENCRPIAAFIAIDAAAEFWAQRRWRARGFCLPHVSWANPASLVPHRDDSCFLSSPELSSAGLPVCRRMQQPPLRACRVPPGTAGMALG